VNSPHTTFPIQNPRKDRKIVQPRNMRTTRKGTGGWVEPSTTLTRGVLGITLFFDEKKEEAGLGVGLGFGGILVSLRD
jgi:hypothetical protein